mgnify:CR=1 FL=1
MTHEGVREATKKAVETAKANGCLVSFDPNLRRHCGVLLILQKSRWSMDLENVIS